MTGEGVYESVLDAIGLVSVTQPDPSQGESVAARNAS